MDVVASVAEIKENLELFERYLCEGSSEEQAFCVGLIQKGRCFVAYQAGAETRFAPSRYIGYAHNSMVVHKRELKNGRDGKKTDPAINQLLGKLAQDDLLEREYLKYCRDLGVQPYENKRKFWFLELGDRDFDENERTGEGFPEGKIIERKHTARERSSVLVTQAKAQFKKMNKRLFCEACGFDFEAVYGNRGADFIEAHHQIPVSEMEASQKTKISDLAMVCSNCHRILHRSRPWLTVLQLKRLLTT